MALQKCEARLGAQKREAPLGANVPAIIHDFLTMRQQRRGCPGQARA
jgi:hypothetical protein